MKKGILVVSAFCLALNIAQAQKKYEKLYYSEVSKEASDITYTGKSAIATKEFIKFNLKIENKGEDMLLYKPEESKLNINNKSIAPKEKWLQIAPGETDNRVVDVKGLDLQVPTCSFEVNGVYKVSTTNKALETADFQLPPSQNEFKTGNFSCTMIALDKETDKTAVKFECRYTGDKIGVIHPGRAAVRLPDGTEIANAKHKKTPMIVTKGESEKFTLVWDRMEGGKATDMQKIKMMIIWRNTFVEADAVKADPVTLDFKIDEAKSK